MYENDFSENYKYEAQLRFCDWGRAFNDNIYKSVQDDSEDHVVTMVHEELSKFRLSETP